MDDGDFSVIPYPLSLKRVTTTQISYTKDNEKKTNRNLLANQTLLCSTFFIYSLFLLSSTQARKKTLYSKFVWAHSSKSEFEAIIQLNCGEKLCHTRCKSQFATHISHTHTHIHIHDNQFDQLTFLANIFFAHYHYSRIFLTKDYIYDTIHMKRKQQERKTTTTTNKKKK